MGKRILGIYLGQREIEAALCRRELRGLRVVEVKRAAAHSSGPAALRSLVAELAPAQAQVVVGLSHQDLFMVEIPHPGLAPQEAREATALSLASYIHCDPDDCLYDCFAYRRGDTTFALLVYCERSRVEPVLDALTQAGVRGRPLLTAAAAGLDHSLRRVCEKSAFPCVSAASQEEELLISLHGHEGWEGSHALPVPGRHVDREALMQLLHRLPRPYDTLASQGLLAADTVTAQKLQQAASCQTAPLPPSVREGGDGRLRWSVATALVGGLRFPPVVLGPSLRRPPLSQRIDPGQVAAAALGLLLAGATLVQGVHTYRLQGNVRRLEAKVARLSKRTEPLVSIRKEMEQLEKRLNQIQDFSKGKGSTLGLMRLLAQRLPSDAWIRNYDYRNGRVRINMEGSTAVDVMEALKGAPLIGSVRLASPVTKYRGKERYTLEIVLKAGRG